MQEELTQTGQKAGGNDREFAGASQNHRRCSRTKTLRYFREFVKVRHPVPGSGSVDRSVGRPGNRSGTFPHGINPIHTFAARHARERIASPGLVNPGSCRLIDRAVHDIHRGTMSANSLEKGASLSQSPRNREKYSRTDRRNRK